MFRGVVGHAWTDLPIHFIDFEGSRASGILEYGVATVVGGRVTATQTRRCAATGRIRPEDTAVHGLREEELAHERPFTDEWERFARWREGGLLGAHFAGVENGLLKSVWPYPRPSPDFTRPGHRIVDWGPWVDTARLYSELYPGLDSSRLETLVRSAGLQGELDQLATQHCPGDRRRYHCALYDALAGALLLARLAQDPQLAALTVLQLLALSTLDPRKRDALQQPELF